MSILNFDDSTVTKFLSEQGTAVLGVEDVRFNGSLVKVTITVENYTSLLADNGPDNYDVESIATLKMFANDGDVIAFDYNDDSFTVLITWHEYMSHKSYTRNYKVQGQSLTIAIGTPYSDER